MKFEYKIALAYVAVGGLWIKFSDKVLDFFVDDPHLLTRLQTFKGWFYVFITGILFYIFLRRHLKKLRMAEAKAKESDALKTAFIQNISHEIRTPMNGIIGFTEILTDRNLTEEERQEYLKIISNCSNQLLGIVNDVLDISMIESGSNKVNPDAFSLNSLLEKILTTFRPAAGKRIVMNIETGLKSPEDIIISDSGKITQVFGNLIGNAIKFTGEGIIRFGYLVEGEYLTFYVIDNGPGISRENQDKIFDRFKKGEHPGNKVYEGVGLGLAICRGIVELLGGRIWAESEPGKGSKFSFTIPYVKGKLPESEKTTEDKQVKLNKMTILLVEDNLPNQIFIREVFKSTSADVIIAANGSEAVERCKENSKIDLVLMDIKMPVMDGYAATAEIRKFNKNIPIIAQTAYALNEREKALDAGFSGYISKPFRRNELLDLVRQYIKI